MDILNYDVPSESWENGLPTGNGRLACMLWEEGEKDIFSLNHEAIWSGKYKDRECEDTAHFLPYVRQYLKEDRIFKATALSALAFGGNGGISPLDRRIDSFQPACDIVVTLPGRLRGRFLDISKGYASSSREHSVLRTFCSITDNCFALEYRFDRPTAFSLSLDREEAEDAQATAHFGENGFTYAIESHMGVSFRLSAVFRTDGCVRASDNGMDFVNATYFTLIADIISDYYEEPFHPAVSSDFDLMLAEHQKAFSRIMGQWTMELSDAHTQETERLPVNRRLERLREGGADPALISLYARFGVYLMASGSHLARLPLNLQGKWNHSTSPKWNSDYHLNVNLQMNYWFTGALSLDDYTRQMTDYVLSLLPAAREAARRLYGCRGAVMLLNSDLWRRITPEAYNYAVWTGAAGWLMLHFWQQYLYTGDKEYLRDYAYPFFKEVALFYEDYIEFDENGTAQIMPSQSPENRFAGGGYFPVTICKSSAMDVQICFKALSIACESARILGLDSDCVEKWKQIVDNLPPFAIGSDGRLLEWDNDSRVEIEPGHRHFSHLYGVYPAAIFTPGSNRAQFDASRASLDYRFAHDGGYTGWSCAWGACLCARFRDTEGVDLRFRNLVGNLSSTTMLDLHPDFHPGKKKRGDDPDLFEESAAHPPMIFQIDGNLGGTAAFLEALMQYVDDELVLLPACPEAWENGKLENIRIPGGHRISFEFRNHAIRRLRVVVGYSGRLSVSTPDWKKEITGEEGSEQLFEF